MATPARNAEDLQGGIAWAGQQNRSFLRQMPMSTSASFSVSTSALTPGWDRLVSNGTVGSKSPHIHSLVPLVNIRQTLGDENKTPRPGEKA
ncbi:hypothetical protein J7T55_005661 [Diaporthe amygdali]|uniref:uncharacterized protein n=1 Tax=Phomopsis amygdali TaxID=1214568 RepID=UPI0022FF16E9|nr:uncharacterized protein J7T55_005661 [Diaporthe amygdali]KAJ0124323.1 hypothetical protein J7T55_005661 [Diaporthe amygdali]